ncbi:proclotting enzyme-like [Topomyia yanbarensis]|uniref:proclotting enzyme-like n=1 Tax=Topomyia yanbarensis TaxID=2498891 RepID=UPI00273ABEBD|nr:proclotting enzyme-like [Topomyia yanbarensis]
MKAHILCRQSVWRWILIGLFSIQVGLCLVKDGYENEDRNIQTADSNGYDVDNALIGDKKSTSMKPAQRRKPFRVLQAERDKKHLDLNQVRKKRFIGDLFKPSKKSFQNCTTPSGAKGHCKRYQDCRLRDTKENIWKILGQLCIIENISIGICCPDILADGTGPEFSARLPAMADDWYDSVEGDNGIASRDGLERPEERGCGISTRQIPKITGGRPADPKEWPWMAALLLNQADQSFCGGVLITDRHVLTAAHCVVNLKIHQFLVRLGEYDFTHYNETRSRDFRVTEIRSHVDFDPVSYENDIALLKLFRPSFFNSYIWPICMPPLDDSWDGYRAVVVGWGTQFFGGPFAKVLMEVDMPIWSNSDCQNVYINRIFETSICAGDHEGGKDSCQGDSGGPLMIQLPNKRWVTVGIVSWGIRCGEANHPGIYTRVSSYVRWVIENAVF